MVNDSDYIDFHCHHPSLHGERALQNGIDTWDDGSTSSVATALFVGECGLDKTWDIPWDEQIKTFRQYIRTSEEYQRPLILHCVRAMDDVLRLRREEHARQPWIWHGYRKGLVQMQQLLPHGFYFSFGVHYHPEALIACPPERLFLETDADEQVDIRQLYHRAAALRGISVKELCLQIQQNLKRLCIFAHV